MIRTPDLSDYNDTICTKTIIEKVSNNLLFFKSNLVEYKSHNTNSILK